MSDKLPKHLWAGKKLEHLRNRLGITQEECAKRSGYNVRAWRRIAAGEMRPPREKLIQRILIDCLQLPDLATVDEVLRFYDYGEVNQEEIINYSLRRSA